MAAAPPAASPTPDPNPYLDHWLSWYASHTPDWADTRLHASGIHSFLTSRRFTPFQLLFLSNGLRFICTPPTSRLPTFIQHFLADNDRGWIRFARTLTQRVLYQNTEQTEYLAKFALPSRSTDKQLSRTADASRQEMSDELYWLERYKQQTLLLLTNVVQHPNNAAAVSRTRSNCSSHDRLFLRELVADSSITIKPADKVLGLAFVDNSWYNAELKRMLADTVTYKKFSSTDAPAVTRLKTQLLADLKKLAKRHLPTLLVWQPEHGERMAKYLSNKIHADSAAIPSIYLLIKVHKPKGLCGRPIVPCTRWITTPASVLADHLLQSILKQAAIPWLVKDTKSLINDLERTPVSDVSGDGIFVTADIASLYTNIDTKTGLKLVRAFLVEQQVPHDRILFLMDLLTFVMENAYLSFHDNVFHQIDGTAMGTSVAPTYANIVVYMLERQLVQEFHTRGTLLIYRRYLDDIFAYIKASDSVEFQTRMNQLDPKLTFEFASDPDSAAFLDLAIHKDKRFRARGIFDTRVHQKKMNLNLYIPFNSFHTTAAKRSFIVTELMRYIRNSSDEEDYMALKRLFFQRLRDRGYPSSFLEPEFNSIFYADRHYFLMDSAEPLLSHPLIHSAPPLSKTLQRTLADASARASSRQKIVFVLPYTPLSAIVPTRKILLDYWSQLQHGFPQAQRCKPIIAYQSEPSLAKSLVFAKEKLHATEAKDAASIQMSINHYFAPRVRSGPDAQPAQLSALSSGAH